MKNQFNQNYSAVPVTPVVKPTDQKRLWYFVGHFHTSGRSASPTQTLDSENSESEQVQSPKTEPEQVQPEESEPKQPAQPEHGLGHF